MPPVPDKYLEERILKAAQRLWRTRGEQGLTLRAVAHAAGTSTPTLYKRYRSKEALLLAVAYRIREEMTADLFKSASLEDTPHRYLAYAQAHPREYELMGKSWGHFASSPRPVRTWLLGQLAARHGGNPDDYGMVYESIVLLCHGASTLLTVAPNPKLVKKTRDTCIQACDNLIQNAPEFAQSRS